LIGGAVPHLKHSGIGIFAPPEITTMHSVILQAGRYKNCCDTWHMPGPSG